MHRFLLAVAALFLVSCVSTPKHQTQFNFEKEFPSETERFRAYADQVFDESVDRYPTYQTYLGIKKDYGKLNDNTEANSFRELEISKQILRELKQFELSQLDEQSQLSYLLLKKDQEDNIAGFKFRNYGYWVTQMFGAHTKIPSFMINMHRVDNESDARNYVSRIREVKRVLGEVRDAMERSRNEGVIPPKFVFPKVIEASQNIISGTPFDESKEDSPLLADFKAKVTKLKLGQTKTEALTQSLNRALKEDFYPAYVRFISYMQNLEKKADARDGVWKFPKGEEFYRYRLEKVTTTKMSPDTIHQLGLTEVDRIHGEMNKIKNNVGFKGSLSEFFKHVKTKKDLFYPNTEKGRAAYLKSVNVLVDQLYAKLPEQFTILPQAKMHVKRVEAYREKSAGIAFYQGPAPDGSRPGRYYANLYDMGQMPKYEMEALAIHEGIPGHHMQIAIATELEELPKFRRYGGYTAYSEGWGLYSESLGKEMGFYKDPYSDFGRLSMELWRACRLVVDTGLHSKKWTREQAINYLLKNTPNDENEIAKGIERYIVMPAQATAYKVGMLKIQELRKRAKQHLGEAFDIRKFHDEILRHGAVPLNVMDQLISKWEERTSLKLERVGTAK